MHARAGPLPDDQVHAKILHRGIENFLERRLQAVNFVEKKKIARIERREHRGEVALFLEQRPGADFDGRAHFVRQNLRERGLAQARRPVEQHVIERLAARARRLHGDLQIFLHAILADVIAEARRADAGFDARVLIGRLPGYDSIARVFGSFWALASYPSSKIAVVPFAFGEGLAGAVQLLRTPVRNARASCGAAWRSPSGRWSDSVADFPHVAQQLPCRDSRRSCETDPPTGRNSRSSLSNSCISFRACDEFPNEPNHRSASLVSTIHEARARAFLHRGAAQKLRATCAKSLSKSRGVGARLFDGVFDGALVVAEIHERGGDVGFQLRARGRLSCFAARPRRRACRAIPRPCVRRSFVPTPGMRTSCARSPLRIAGTSSSRPIPERIFSASDGPTPEAEISSSKHCFSRAVRNP